MRRLMTVLVVVLIGAGVVEAGRHPTLQNPQGYRRVIGRGRHPTLQNPQGYLVGYYDYYGYGYGYGCYPKNAQNSYPSGSLLSGLLGISSYNEEQYWAYQNRLLDIGEKQSQQSGSSHPYISDPQLLEQAKQRGKLQKLEDENQHPKVKIAEMEAQKKEDENRRLRERIAELEKKKNNQLAK